MNATVSHRPPSVADAAPLSLDADQRASLPHVTVAVSAPIEPHPSWFPLPAIADAFVTTVGSALTHEPIAVRPGVDFNQGADGYLHYQRLGGADWGAAMAYKTVLVLCNDKDRVSQVAEPAARVAAQFGAHLVGLSVTPPVHVAPTGMPGTPDTLVIDEHCKAYRKHNPEMRAAFEAAARGHNLTAEWREVDAGSRSVTEAALEHASAVDLIVAGQKAGLGQLDIADRLVLGSGRPVLIVPRQAAVRNVGARILVGWNGHREAARAAFDALPLLKRAEWVKAICVNPQLEGGPARHAPPAEVCAALARHGVKCQATEAVGLRTHDGKTLLACAQDNGADLLVMGCYGHSRFREFVFGGASAHVLEHMTLPVLMSH
jgi:nucleotide-binding universal stress UspA family protein